MFSVIFSPLFLLCFGSSDVVVFVGGAVRLCSDVTLPILVCEIWLRPILVVFLQLELSRRIS